MPTIDQFSELINSRYTTTELTTMNGVSGRMITSKSNGKSLFLPAAGFRYDTSLGEAGSRGLYWSRTLDTSLLYYDALILYCRSVGVVTGGGPRCYGVSVRPVRVTRDETAIATPAAGTDGRERTAYDLSGRRVRNPQRGLYIINNKKVYVR